MPILPSWLHSNVLSLPKQYGQTDLDQGSSSTGGIWDSRFVYKVPENMASEHAAPPLCGGWTVWNALTGYDLKPTDHVGILGIGGLGHLAIQFANQISCEVTAFSGTKSKRVDAPTLGADHFVTRTRLKERAAMLQDWSTNCLFAQALRFLGSSSLRSWREKRRCFRYRFQVIFPLNFSVPPHMPFLLKSINVVYSTNGRHDAYDKMSAFPALHGVKPVSEKFPMT
jgi:D-arabinose 1-dehydrogenase-like Zn-dependent alcohol dehydrogenase